MLLRVDNVELGDTRLMQKFRWERHDFDHSQKKHVKVSEGHFTASTLHGAKLKSSRQSGIGNGVWLLDSAEMSIVLKGRIYLKQASVRPEYANLNPKLYLFVL